MTGKEEEEKERERRELKRGLRKQRGLWRGKESNLDRSQLMDPRERRRNSPFPKNLMLSIAHCVLVKGELTNFELRTLTDVEATELYPDLKYTTLDDILGKLA
ncbi:hypothetical protein Droror1_Dr00021877 [Drosera rotundifolia]